MQQELSLLNVARNLVLPLITAVLLAGCGANGSPAPVVNRPAIMPGQVLSTAVLKGAPGFVNAGGFTVYVFDADLNSPGHSTCNGACTQNWPPVAPPMSNLPAPFSTIMRDDGSKQLAYKSRPLYTFAFDTAVGDTFGDGVNAFGGLWHIARPSGSSGTGSGMGGGY